MTKLGMKLSEYRRQHRDNPSNMPSIVAENKKKAAIDAAARADELAQGRDWEIREIQMRYAEQMERMHQFAIEDGLLDVNGRPPWARDYEGPVNDG